VYAYRLDGFKCNDGSKFELGDMTVIIGPNNAGKSQALRDLVTITTEPQGSWKAKVIIEATKSKPTNLDSLWEAYPRLRGTKDSNGIHIRGLDVSLQKQRNHVWGGAPEQIEQGWRTSIGNNDKLLAAQLISSSLTTHLTTENRLTLVNSGPNATSDSAASLLQQLYLSGSEKEIELRKLVKDNFDVEIVLDYTIPATLCFRVAEQLKDIPPDPRDARSVLAEFEKLDDHGDGLRSFVGIAAALLVMDRPVCLIDEPEAFLHPPQAYALGRFMAGWSGPQRQLVMATHSADVLRGVLSVKDDVSVIRIDRLGNTNSFRRLARDRLLEITKDPLLASHRVFDGLFSAASIVVEADADERFYETVFNKVHPNADAHFVSADNKQTVPRIMSLYRELGVRTAGIVDIDVLNDAKEFGKQISALGLNSNLVDEAVRMQSKLMELVTGMSVSERANLMLAALNSAIQLIEDAISTGGDSAGADALTKASALVRRAIEAGKPWADAKAFGVDSFDSETKTAFESVYSVCSDGGLFINRYGELESMLSDVGVLYTTDKRSWIQTAINVAANLSYPSQKKSFQFMEAVDAHLFPKKGRREGKEKGVRDNF